MAFSLQPYPQPFLIFFCPKQKSFMKCAFITPFSTNVSFSHTIYLPTDTTTVDMLFLSPFLSEKELLGQELEEKKEPFSAKRSIYLEL